MSDVPATDPHDQVREGIFPDVKGISDQWQKTIADISGRWEAKVDHLSGQIDELINEVKSLKGVTVTIDRGQ